MAVMKLPVQRHLQDYPYLCNVFNGGLVQHLLQYSRIGQTVCAVVVTCHNHAPAKIQTSTGAEERLNPLFLMSATVR